MRQSKKKSSGKVYGYARAATQKQKARIQSEKIREKYPEAEIYEDDYSGIRYEHPGWIALDEKLQRGDLLILCDITKLADLPESCAEIYADLFHRGIRILFLDDPLLSSEIFSDALAGSDAKGEASEALMLAAASQIRISHALKLEKIKKTGDKIRESLIRSQEDGKPIGRPQGKKYRDGKKATEAKQKIWELSADFQGSIPDAELIEIVGLARNTFYKYKKYLSLYGNKPDAGSNNRRDAK